MKLFSSMKIGTRLALGFAVVLAFAVLITGIGVWQLNALSNATREMMQEPLSKERYISDWSRNINVAVIRTTAVAKSTDPTLVPFFAANAAEITKSTTSLLKQIEPLIKSTQEKALFAQISDVRKAYLTTRDQVTKLKASGQTDEANNLLEKAYLPAADNYMKLVGEFLNMQRQNLDGKAAEISAIESTSRNSLIALAAFVLALGVVFAWRSYGRDSDPRAGRNGTTASSPVSYEGKSGANRGRRAPGFRGCFHRQRRNCPGQS